ncbi:MAG: adenosylmethionine--8-amino-7-oxononanoate transaminase [Pseudomonadota bacterium]
MSSPPDLEGPWIEAGLPHLWLPYTQMKTAPRPVPVTGTAGSRVILADGTQLVDGTSSWWTACHGYNHPHIVGAVRAQLDAMPHVMMGGLLHEPVCRLAERLIGHLPRPLDRIFFSESGSVSVEVALKMAIQYWRNRGDASADAPHTAFICFDGGYHGDTTGAMSVSDPDEGFHEAFRGSILPQIRLPLPQTPETKARFLRTLTEQRHTLAGVIIEPWILGAGGMQFYSADVLRFIRAACDEQDMLLIFDEIMTGFGRTGTMFICSGHGVVPDILTLSKALTGGTLPFAATVSSSKVSEPFLSDDPDAALMHGPTYMGNPLGCAAAHASLDLFEAEPRMAQVARIERGFRELLEPARSLPRVKDVRVRGAIGVIEIDGLDNIPWLKTRFIEKGVLVRPFGSIIYATPPFILNDGELEQLATAMVEVTAEWAQLPRAA